MAVTQDQFYIRALAVDSSSASSTRSRRGRNGRWTRSNRGTTSAPMERTSEPSRSSGNGPLPRPDTTPVPPRTQHQRASPRVTTCYVCDKTADSDIAVEPYVPSPTGLASIGPESRPCGQHAPAQPGRAVSRPLVNPDSSPRGEAQTHKRAGNGRSVRLEHFISLRSQ